MFKLQEVLTAVSGELVQGSLKGRVRGISTDTRKIAKGDLFVAIKGENFDGHQFIARAVESGAAAVLIGRGGRVDLPCGVPAVVVDDTVKALGCLAQFHRARFKIPLIAITGSAGKTTTKEFVAAVLKKKFNVLYNKGTENNHIGVPMTLLQLRKKHDAAVLELGTNHFGEIAWLAEIVRPTVAVFTNVGHSHIAGFGSPQGVFEEKSTLLNFLPKDGTVIVNMDDPLLRTLARKKGARKIIGYGIDHKADLKAEAVTAEKGGLIFSLGKARFVLKTPVWGNIYNALAAIACGQLFRISADKIAQALKTTDPAKGRQCFQEAKGVTVIDDTYNSNPVSFRNALRTLSLMKKTGCVFVVAGDMLELGDESDRLHADLGEPAAHCGTDRILTFGRWSGHIGQSARKIRPALEARHFGKQEDILALLKRDVVAGDIVLVKGSRGMRMENIVNGLIAHLKERA